MIRLVALVVVAMAIVASRQGAADVAVLHGATTEVVPTARGAGVTVLRGTPPAAAAAPAAPAARRVTIRPGAIAAGGDTLWLIDRRGRMFGCWLQGTGYVGELKVSCSRP